MSRLLYFDCFSGISGDMVLGALLDAGLPFEDLKRALGSLSVSGYDVTATRVLRAGVSATKFNVRERGQEHARSQDEGSHADKGAPAAHDHSHAHDHEPQPGYARAREPGHDHAHGHAHPRDDSHGHVKQPHSHGHRSLPEIFALIDRSALSSAGRDRAKALFQRLAEAEATIHQMPVEKVHLHEVGALDSIIDIVGAVFALEWVGADRIVCSPLNVGGGTVRSVHGLFPVPAPATVRLLGSAPIYSGPVQKELVTPTGALLATAYASSFGPLPAMSLEQVGYGAGDADHPDTPNVLRVFIGHAADRSDAERVVVIECEIDDMNPQLFGVAMERLYAAGALEVFYVAVQMKKNRPGTLLTVVSAPERRAALADVIFRETTTIGLRHYEVERECLRREIVAVETPVGAVRFKLAWRDGRVINAVPEFDDCARLAAASGISVKDVQAVAIQAYGTLYPAIIVSRFYITTPIYYINAEPHLGHAYTTMVADAVARAHRLMGDDVFFLTGTDEHGQKVERAAKKAGLRTPEFADRVAQKFRDLLPTLNIANDDFIRTTEPRHYAASQELWRRVRDRGHIYKGTYEGWYCTVDEVFVPDTQLQNGKCPICGNAVERIAEESYFFRLSAFQQPLIQYYKDHPDFVTPANRRNEMLSFLEAGLDDLSVSRTSFKWGIPVPDDPAHVMYVWFDALTNYMTAVGFGSKIPEAGSRFETYWPADVHLIGKEIVRQHAIYWPAFLLAAELPLPRQIAGHGWWLMEGAKMSKSLGNVVRPQVYIDRFGLDALRYFVFREMMFGQDASFTDEAFLTRYNSDLANDLGNLVSRATTMIHRYRLGVVPTPDPAFEKQEELALGASLEKLIESVKASIRLFQSSAALREIWDVIGATNRYIVTREPWVVAKDPSRAAELDTSLYAAADAVRIVAEVLRPFIPDAAERTLRMLGVEPDAQSWRLLSRGQLAPGSRLGVTTPLFPRMDHSVEELRQMADKPTVPPIPPGAPVPPEPTREQTTPPPGVPTPAVQPSAVGGERISIDDFMKVEIRVAKVLSAERVPKSSKLVKLSVDVGTEQRTIVAGIAEAYEPESLVGRTVAIVFNLRPAKLMGVESNGMVLAASPEGGKPMLVSFVDPPAPGTRVR